MSGNPSLFKSIGNLKAHLSIKLIICFVSNISKYYNIIKSEHAKQFNAVFNMPQNGRLELILNHQRNDKMKY